jgi:hypothetical protein
MAKEEMELYLDLHKEESDTFHSDVEENTTPEKTQKGNPQHAKMAKLYEDAAEYEEDLRIFENELEIVNNNILKDIASELIKAFPEEEDLALHNNEVCRQCSQYQQRYRFH